MVIIANLIPDDRDVKNRTKQAEQNKTTALIFFKPLRTTATIPLPREEFRRMEDETMQTILLSYQQHFNVYCLKTFSRYIYNKNAAYVSNINMSAACIMTRSCLVQPFAVVVIISGI